MSDGPVCITCGDVAIAMRVVRAAGDDGLSDCVTDTGERASVETSLIEDVREGDELLVHACVAIQRLDPVEARA